MKFIFQYAPVTRSYRLIQDETVQHDGVRYNNNNHNNVKKKKNFVVLIGWQESPTFLLKGEW